MHAGKRNRVGVSHLSRLNSAPPIMNTRWWLEVVLPQPDLPVACVSCIHRQLKLSKAPVSSVCDVVEKVPSATTLNRECVVQSVGC